jgi:hypothetical protein
MLQVTGTGSEQITSFTGEHAELPDGLHEFGRQQRQRRSRKATLDLE